LGTLDTESIRRSIEQLELRRGAAQDQISEANRVLQAVDRELTLLKELLRLRDGPSSESGAKPLGVANSIANLTSGYGATGTSRVVDAVTQILTEAGEALPIRVIYDQLKRQGVPLPGQGRMVNVIAAMRRADTIARPARGVYGLTAWGMVDGQNDRRKRRRRSAQAAKTTARRGGGSK